MKIQVILDFRELTAKTVKDGEEVTKKFGSRVELAEELVSLLESGYHRVFEGTELIYLKKEVRRGWVFKGGI